jgi:hypothetical protein
MATHPLRKTGSRGEKQRIRSKAQKQGKMATFEAIPWKTYPAGPPICRYRKCKKPLVRKRPWQIFCDGLCRKREWDLAHPLVRVRGEKKKIRVVFTRKRA